MAETNSVFISYRREAGALWALALYQQLTSRGIDAFYDIEDVREAGQFNTKLLNQIAARPYFLIVLTPGTLTRCVEAGDWLRREIEHAIGTKRVVVPLFTAQFDFADLNAYLPAPIAAELRNFHGVELSTTWFNEVIRRLTTELLVPISSEVRRSAEDEEHVKAANEAAARAPTVTQDRLKAQEHLEQARERPATALDAKIADYDQAIRLDPGNVTAFYQRGPAREAKGDTEGAAADLQQAMRLDASAPDSQRETEATAGVVSDRVGLSPPTPKRPSPPPPPAGSQPPPPARTGEPPAEPRALTDEVRARRRRRSIFIVVLSAVVVSIVAVVLVVAFSSGSHGGSTTTTTAPDEPSTTTTTAPDEPSTTSKDTSAPVTPDDSLRPDDVLRARRSIASSNQRHTLQMTEAGVLMAATDGEVWWRQAAPYRPGSIAIMQNDGNFVVYGPGPISADNAMWSSGTSGHDDAGAYLVIEDVGGYGRIAIRTPNGTELWSTQDPRLPPATTTKATKGTTTT